MLENKKILLLEDDLVDVMTLKRAMKQLSVTNELIVADNGNEGLEYLLNSEELPGIIFLDINMPKMNGLEFLEVIRRNEHWESIPVILLTTSKDQQDKMNAFRLGISGYFVKSVDYHEFKDQMSTILKYWSISEHPY